MGGGGAKALVCNSILPSLPVNEPAWRFADQFNPNSLNQETVFYITPKLLLQKFSKISISYSTKLFSRCHIYMDCADGQ